MARIAVAVTAILVSLSACQSSRPPLAQSSTEPRIELNTNTLRTGTVDVVGLPAEQLSQLSNETRTPDDWTALLRIQVRSESSADLTDRPAVLGTYAVAEDVLRFTPQFPFDPGQRYDVRFDASRLPARGTGAAEPWRTRQLQTSFAVPRVETLATTRVVGVFPSAAEVPENQLRLYVVFSAPMSLGGGAAHVRLLDDANRIVDDPFLPLDVELWNEDRTRYTVLFDPGRVKRGILPNQEMGRSLVAGHEYTLVVDEGWRDAAGQPLAAPFRRSFRVGPPAERAIAPATWRLEPPLAKTRAPLIVSFPEPLDYALLQRALTVSLDGQRVSGDVRLEAGETRWLFLPHAPWVAGEYQLHASSILEDVAGNRIGRPFEVEALAGGRLRTDARSAELRFRVAASTR